MAFVMPFFAAIGSAAGASAATAGMAGLALTSAAVGVAGAVQSGRNASAAARSESDAANYNAAMNDIQAKQAYTAAGAQEDEQRKRARTALGSQLASSAEAGAGLNTDLLRESLFNTEGDANAIRYEGSLKAQGLRDSAILQRSNAQASAERGKSAVTGSYLNAAGSVLNAGTSYYKGKK